MSDILDFELAQRNRDTDAYHTFTDDKGVKWFKFIVEFEHEGCFSFNLWARNQADADAKLDSIKTNGHIVGQLCSEIRCD